MKVALFGRGRMGALVTEHLRRAGHTAGTVFASDERGLSVEQMAARLAGHDVAIDFSVGTAVPRNVSACVLAGVPVVEGATGWHDVYDTVVQGVKAGRGGLVVGENLSIGVNLFYRVVARAAELYGSLGGYSAFIEEAHHALKRDAPSGTALRLKVLLADQFGQDVAIASTRAGQIPGVHRVGFDGPHDQVTLEHSARSREGFAEGAILAAQWLVGKRGVYRFSDVLDDLLGGKA